MDVSLDTSYSPKKIASQACRADFNACLFSRPCTAFPGAAAHGSAETGPSGLVGCLGVFQPGAYAPGSAEIGPSGLVGHRGLVWVSGRGFFWFGLPAFAIQA